MWEQLFLDQNIIGNMMATRIEGVHNFQSDPRHYVSIPPAPAPAPATLNVGSTLGLLFL